MTPSRRVHKSTALLFSKVIQIALQAVLSLGFATHALTGQGIGMSQTAPTAYAASAITPAGFTANWSNSSGATGYRLDVSTSGTFDSFVTGYQDLTVGNVTSKSVSGLSANSTYYYRVRTYTAEGTSGNSNFITVVTIPTAPIIKAASLITSTGFTANWSLSSGATGYRLDVSTSNAFNSFVTGYQDLDVGNVTSMAVSGLSTESLYYYRVRAYTPDGNSSYSNFISVTTSPIAPAVPVANAASSITSASFTANWSLSSGASSYHLDVSTSSTFNSFLTGYQDLTIGNATSKVVSGLNANNTYYYRVRAYTTEGNSNNSNSITAITLPGAPTANVAFSITAAEFIANWLSPSGGASGYRLDVSTSSTFNSFFPGYQDLDVGNVTSIAASGLRANSMYYYRVRAYTTEGTSINSNSISVVTLPSAPTANAASSITSTGFTANWLSSLGGASGYRLDVSTSSTFGSLVTGYQDLTVGNTTSKAVIGLNANTTYYYRVRAYTTEGTSNNSNPINVITLSSAPTANAASSITSAEFTANWSNSPNATGYRLDVSISSIFNSFVTGYQDLDVGNVTSMAVNGLSADTTYYYRVRAYTAEGTSSNSNFIAVTTLAAAPAAPVANVASSITATGFTVNWSNSPSATGYRLDVSTSSAFSSFVTGYQDLTVGNSTSKAVSGLDANSTYYYRVRAYAPEGTSNNSNPVTVITLPNAPAANAASSLTAAEFTANWLSSSGGATGYRIDVSISSAFSSFVSGYQDLDVGNVTNMTVIGLSANSAYYYRVRAYTSEGTSSNSNSVTVVTLPSTPTASAASSITSTGFSANWLSPTSGATSYRLDVSTSSTFSSFVTGYQDLIVGNVTSKAVSGLSASSTYYYRVRASNAGGNSNNSNSIIAITLSSAPTANAASSITATGFTANWSLSSGATGYRLDVSINSLFNSYVTGYQDLDVGNVTSMTVSGLNADSIYYYRVRAYSPEGTGSNSNSMSVTTSLAAPVAPVANAASSISSTAFTANWSSSSGAAGYRLDVSISSDFSSFVTGYQDLTVGNAISKVVSGLSGNSTYYYRVRTFTADGISNNSNSITVITLPNAPTANAASSITATEFTADWLSPSGGAAGYRLDVSISSTFNSFVTGYQDLIIESVTSKVVSGLSANSIYYYRVRAYTSEGTSNNSSPITVITLPNAPTANSASSATSAGFTANWLSPSGGATGYRLDVSTNSAFTSFVTGYQDLAVSSATSKVVSALSANSTYYYRVRASNAAGTSSNSNFISVTTLLNAPAANAASAITSTGFTANWLSPSGSATGYRLDVSTSSTFNSFVIGYQDLVVGNVTSKAISGLNDNSTYYYRVRASNAEGTSNNSNVIAVSLVNIASITGQVLRYSDRTGISGITIQAYNSAWSSVQSTTTDSSGYYSIKGLNPGSYYLKTSNNAGWRDEYYDGVTAQGSATVINLAAGQIALNINFTLSKSKPIRADFNSDGQSDILWRYRYTGDMSLWFISQGTQIGSGSLPSNQDLLMKIAGIADFNQDGENDILWCNKSTGDNLIWFMVGINKTSETYLDKLEDFNWTIAGVADFNGDDKPDILWRNKSTGDNLVWYMNGTTHEGSAGIDAVPDLNWNIAGVDDFNSDSKPDVLWRNKSTGQNNLWHMNGTIMIDETPVDSVSDLNWKIVAVGDYDGNGQSDIIWRNTSTGDNAIWLMNGATISSAVILDKIADTNWLMFDKGEPEDKVAVDFNNDGNVDILWRNSSTGLNIVWYMNGNNSIGAQLLDAVSDVNWKISALADFNNDGNVDILWRNYSTGTNYAWYMNGESHMGGDFLDAVEDVNWKIVGAADFNGDGNPDILWRNFSNGLNYVWFMDGTRQTYGAFINAVPDLDWKIAGIADFNGDGKPDILWRNSSTGLNYVWHMDSISQMEGYYLDAVADVSWNIAMLADFNKDGKVDILWRNETSGQNIVWYMNGITQTGNDPIPAVADITWEIAGGSE